MIRSAFITILIFVVAGIFKVSAVSLRAGIVQGFPKESEPVRATATYFAPMGLQFHGSSVSRSNTIVRVTQSYLIMCGGERNPCLPGLEIKHDTVEIGILPPGKYTLLWTARTVDAVFCEEEPCEPIPRDSLTDTISFEVVPDAVQTPALVGFYYYAREGMVRGDSRPAKLYRYTNGDTLSIALIHTAGCCARYNPHVSGFGDTLIIMLQDTGELCDCGSRVACVTAAISPVSAVYRYVRMIVYPEMKYSGGGSGVTFGLALDSAAPSLCINISDSIAEGIRLYVDSSWFAYEIVAPRFGIGALRLQPGGGSHVGSTPQYLYVDSIATSDCMREEFDGNNLDSWTIVRSWNGVILEPRLLSFENGRLLELLYRDLGAMGRTAYMYHPQNAGGDFPCSVAAPVRLFVKASCRNPGNTTVNMMPKITKRFAGISDGSRLIFDLQGRTVGSNVAGQAAKNAFSAHGLYLLFERGKALRLPSVDQER